MAARWTASVLVAGSLFLLPPAGPVAAQQGVTFGLSGYAINVASASQESLFSQGGLSDFQRLREMLKVSGGFFTVDIAYEQALLLAEKLRFGGTLS